MVFLLFVPDEIVRALEIGVGAAQELPLPMHVRARRELRQDEMHFQWRGIRLLRRGCGYAEAQWRHLRRDVVAISVFEQDLAAGEFRRRVDHDRYRRVGPLELSGLKREIEISSVSRGGSNRKTECDDR